MVGTDPKRGSSTTVISSVIVPLRFVFADGSVFDASTDLVDGQTPVNGMLNSPIFQAYDFVLGGTNVGTTQYGDAFQRANFWKDVSRGSHDYHVLLGGPNVIPAQTIVVPNGKFDYLTDPATGQVFPIVDDVLLYQSVVAIMQNFGFSPQSLPIFLTGTVSDFSSWGYHGLILNGNTAQTYIVTTYQPHDAVFYGQRVPDVYVPSHEVAEWMDDPFIGNLTPGWNYVGYPQPQCQDNPGLEVGDPFTYLFDTSVVPVSNTYFTYHVTDATFLDFFTRSAVSRSVNGQYSMFGASNGPTPACVGRIYVGYTFFAFPGARSTRAFGINNTGQIVGSYRDASGRTHGFLLDHGNFTSIDSPGARATTAYKINESGVIVGYFTDSSGLPHGFAYRNGSYAQIDFPGAIDTVASGINSAGDIVGGFDDQNFVTHQFRLHNGRYQQLDTPFAPQSDAIAINDSGSICGLFWNDPAQPSTGFVSYKNVVTPFSISGSLETDPYSINNRGDLSGFFFNSNGYSSGFVTIYGYQYQIDGFAFGNNDKGQIVGSYNFGGGHIYGYVADLPK
jgi:probable HAF family extracellular repeat protein